MVPLIASVAAVFFGIVVVFALVCWCMTQRRSRRRSSRDDYMGAASTASCDSLDDSQSSMMDSTPEKIQRIDIDEAAAVSRARKVQEKRAEALPMQNRSNRVLLDVKRLSSNDNVRNNVYTTDDSSTNAPLGGYVKSNGRGASEKFHREDVGHPPPHGSRATRVRRARVYSAGSSAGNRSSIISFDQHEPLNHLSEKQQQCTSNLSLASLQQQQRTSSPAGQAGPAGHSVQHYRSEKQHRRVPDTQQYSNNYEIVDQEDDIIMPVSSSSSHLRHHESARLLPCDRDNNEPCGCELNRTSSRYLNNRTSLADCAESEEVAVLMDPRNHACTHHTSSSSRRCQHHCSSNRRPSDHQHNRSSRRSRRQQQPTTYFPSPCGGADEPPDSIISSNSRTSHVEATRHRPLSAINDSDLPPYESVISASGGSCGVVETRMTPTIPPCLDCNPPRQSSSHLPPSRPTSQPHSFAGSPISHGTGSPCHHHQSPPPSYSRHCPRTPQTPTWSQTEVSVAPVGTGSGGNAPSSRGNVVWSRSSYGNHRGSIEDDGVYTNNERGEIVSESSTTSSSSKNNRLSHHELSV